MEKLIVSPGFVKKIEDEQDTQDQAIASNSQAIAKVQNGLAYIVGNTNTTGGTLAVGQFVYVKNHSTIAEGLRKVTASISANGNITTSNTSECTEGGLNKLKGDVDALNSNKVDLYGGTYYEYTSMDAMQNGLLAMASNIGNNKTAMAVIWPNFSGYFGGAEGCASISVRTPSYFSVLFHSYNDVYYGKYLNGTWTWNSFSSKIKDQKITSIGSYFTERDAFKARRVGNTIDFFGYVNITTEVPAATNFADIGFSTAEGNVLFVTADGSTQRLVHCTQGKLKPESGFSLPTGYYYIVGCAVMVVS